MTETTTNPSLTTGGMQIDELLLLPVAFDLNTSNRALGIGRTKGFLLAKKGQYPIPVMRVGNAYRVTRVALLSALGIDPTSSGAEEKLPGHLDATERITSHQR